MLTSFRAHQSTVAQQCDKPVAVIPVEESLDISCDYGDLDQQQAMQKQTSKTVASL